MSNESGRFFRIFVAFSENMNFRNENVTSDRISVHCGKLLMWIGLEKMRFIIFCYSCLFILQPLKADACLLLLGLQASIYLILVDWLFISLSAGFFFSRLDLPTFNRKVLPQVWLRWFIKGYWQLFGCVVQGT